MMRDITIGRGTLRMADPMIMELIVSLHNLLWMQQNSHPHYQMDTRTLTTSLDILSADTHTFPIQTSILQLLRHQECILLLMRKIAKNTFLIKDFSTEEEL